MGRTAAGTVTAVVLAAILGGCGGEADRPTGTPPAGTPPAGTPPAASAGARVVDHTGLAGIEFGDTRAELKRDHGLVRAPGDCAPRLPAYPSVSPVLDGDRLVLLWVEPPLHTPAGITVGSPVGEVHAAHPDAERLRAPEGSFRFDGLLATVGDRAYLFLHDDRRVQKVIVGYQEHARRVFHGNYGTC